MSAAIDTLTCLEEHGYSIAFEGGRLKVAGSTAPPPELEQLIVENRHRLAARALLTNPPAWLTKLFDLYWSGHETPVRLSAPSGKAEVYMVSVSIRNITAAVGAEIRLPRTRWPEIQPEVEEALGTWEGAA